MKLRTSPTSFGTETFSIAATFYGTADIHCAPKYDHTIQVCPCWIYILICSVLNSFDVDGLSCSSCVRPITIMSIFWNILAAAENQYPRNPKCVVNVVMFRDSFSILTDDVHFLSHI